MLALDIVLKNHAALEMFCLQHSLAGLASPFLKMTSDYTEDPQPQSELAFGQTLLTGLTQLKLRSRRTPANVISTAQRKLDQMLDVAA